MARPRGNWTLDQKSYEYLKKHENQSRIIDEALELHKNKDKMIIKPMEYKVNWTA